MSITLLPVARKKEPTRIRLTARVLPDTDEAIRKQVVKRDGQAGTLGKVLDKQFGGGK